MWDLDMDEPLTLDVVAETVGAKRSLIVRLAQQGLIETVERGADEHSQHGLVVTHEHDRPRGPRSGRDPSRPR